MPFVQRPEREGGRTLAAEWAGTIVSLAIGMLLTVLLAKTDEYEHLVRWGSDFAQRARAPASDDHLVVVEISAGAFRRSFGGTRPLDSRKVGMLVARSLAGGARAVGVLLDASAPEVAVVRRQFASNPRVVWFADGFWRDREDRFVMSLEDTSVGLAALPSDGDGAKRSYDRYFPALLSGVEGPTTIRVPSFSTTLLSAANRLPKVTSPDTCDRLIDFVPGRLGTPFIQVDAEGLLEQSASVPEGVFSDAIVVIGAAFSKEDEYKTAIGWQTAPATWMHVVHTELTNPNGPCRPGEGFMVFWAIVDAVVLGLLFKMIRGWRGIAAGVVAALAIAVLASERVYGNLGHVGYFIPTLAFIGLNRLRERG